MIPAHDLMPPELREVMPDLYFNEHTDDPVVQAKYFTPDAGATWLITEFDGEDTLFGFAYLGAHLADCAEMGYISLAELRALRGKLGMPVERDLYWKPMPLSAAMQREFNL